MFFLEVEFLLTFRLYGKNFNEFVRSEDTNRLLDVTDLTNRRWIGPFSDALTSCAIAWDRRSRTRPSHQRPRPIVAPAGRWAWWPSSVTTTIRQSIWAAGAPNTIVQSIAAKMAPSTRNATRGRANAVVKIIRIRIRARRCRTCATLAAFAPTAWSATATASVSNRVNAEIASATDSVTHITSLSIGEISLLVVIALTWLPGTNFPKKNRKSITISRLDCCCCFATIFTIFCCF